MVLDYRNKKGLYGRELQMTFRGVGDQMAAAAQLVNGGVGRKQTRRSPAGI